MRWVKWRRSIVLFKLNWTSYTHTHTHTRLTGRPFVWHYPGEPVPEGKTNLDLNEARDSEWQWHQLGHMQVCTSLQTDNHASTPLLSLLQAGCPSCRPTNSVIKALKAETEPVSLTKCPYDHWLTKKAYLSAIAVTNVSPNFYIQDGGINQLAQMWNKITSLSPSVFDMDWSRQRWKQC